MDARQRRFVGVEGSRGPDSAFLDRIHDNLDALVERVERLSERVEEVAVLSSRVDAIERRTPDISGPNGLLARVKVLEALKGTLTVASSAAVISAIVAVVAMVLLLTG